MPLPAFFPDATYGAIRAGSFEDVERAGLFGCEMNSYHLMNRPGARLIKSLGGLHGFTGYRGAILTDSGGFQLYSLIRENAGYGEIRDKEIIFRPDRGREKLTFTPEKCIQVQFQYGSDIMMALDMCTHPDDPAGVQRTSVGRTVAWGARCRTRPFAWSAAGGWRRSASTAMASAAGRSTPAARSARTSSRWPPTPCPTAR